jgi:exosortase
MLALLYWETGADLYRRWDADPNYSHGFLVPLLSGWLAWRWYRRAGAPTEGQAGLGGLSIIVGCLVHLAAYVAAFPPLAFVGLVLVLRGIAVTAGGRAWARGFTFPLLFLFFMFPLPVHWTSAAAVWLQDVVSQVSTGLLNLVFVCRRTGNTIFLAGVGEPLVVAEECSGLRQIVAFVALAFLVGYLSGRPLLFRGLLALAAIPVAVAANVLRVLLMAVGSRCFGTVWLSSWLHDAPALLTMPLGLGLLVLAAWVLAQLWPPEAGDERREAGEGNEPRHGRDAASLPLANGLVAVEAKGGAVCS